MATLSTAALTLSEWAKRLDPKGKVPFIVELLNETNEVLDDMTFMEGNLPTGHLATVRTGLPSTAWRTFNGGTTPSRSHTNQITFQCGMLEAWSEVDCDLAKLNGNVNKFRMTEAKAFLESMSQECAGTLFYGNAGTAPAEFNGLSTIYNSTTAGNGDNIVLGGGSGSDNSSIWLVVWGENKVSGIFPKGSKAGLIHQDLGEVTVQTATGIGGGRLRAFQDRFQWKVGLAVEDWRYAVRIANIDISNLAAQSGAADLPSLMIQALYRIPNIKAGKAAFYMNRSCAQYLDIERRSDVISGGGLTYEVVDGKKVMSFRGVPIKICDQLTEAESAVS